MGPEERLGDLLALVWLFNQKGLLTFSESIVLKDLLLAPTHTPGRHELLSVCTRYELDALSEDRNLELLLALHEDMEVFIQTRLALEMDRLFDEISLSHAHQMASIGASNMKSSLPHTLEYDSRCLIYGEIECMSFARLLGVARSGLSRDKVSKFVDLGSGAAKAVLWASLVANFDLFVGIELNPFLHKMSLGVLDQFEEQFKTTLFATKFSSAQRPPIELVAGSFLQLDIHDWTDADVVFINSASFTEELLAGIAVLAARMRIGSRVITLTNALPEKSVGKKFKVVYRERSEMSWGAATVFVHERLDYF
jgi:hypothetical protein